MNISIPLPSGFWREFRSKLLGARVHHEEVIGFLVCSRQKVSKDQIRLIPRNYVVPLPAEYTYQTISGLSLCREFHVKLINEFLAADYEVVHVHSHPGLSSPSFSSVDDEQEADYARFLANYDGTRTFVSGWFNEDFTECSFRRWDLTTISPSYNVTFKVGNLISLAELPRSRASADEVLSREQVFGDEFRHKLEQLRVGLVGCGGIGSIVVDQLSRLGAANWALIDPEVIEKSNLNRIPSAYNGDIGTPRSIIVRN